MKQPVPKFSVGNRAMIMKGLLEGRIVDVDKVGICPIVGIPNFHFSIDWGDPCGAIGYAFPETWGRVITDE